MAELSLYPSLYRSLPKQGNPCLHSSHLRLGNCLSVRRVGLGAEGLVVGRFGTDGIRCSRQQISQRKIESPRALGVHSRHIPSTPLHPPAPPPPAPARGGRRGCGRRQKRATGGEGCGCRDCRTQGPFKLRSPSATFWRLVDLAPAALVDLAPAAHACATG